MALNSNALTTLATAKAYLKIPPSETSMDSLIELFINSSSEALERETDRILSAKNIVEYHDGRRQNIITLREWPIIAVTELMIDYNSEFAVPDNIIDAAEYAVTDNGQSLLLINGSFPKGYRNIRVTYSAGYQTIPSDLEHACLWMVTWYAKIRNSEDIGRTSKSKEGETVSYSQSMPQDVKDCIARYKRTDFFVGNASLRNL